jgi:hypothetical protein
VCTHTPPLLTDSPGAHAHINPTHQLSEGERAKLKSNLKMLADNFSDELEQLTERFRQDRSMLQEQIAHKERELQRRASAEAEQVHPLPQPVKPNPAFLDASAQVEQVCI